MQVGKLVCGRVTGNKELINVGLIQGQCVRVGVLLLAKFDPPLVWFHILDNYTLNFMQW